VSRFHRYDRQLIDATHVLNLTEAQESPDLEKPETPKQSTDANTGATSSTTSPPDPLPPAYAILGSTPDRHEEASMPTVGEVVEALPAVSEVLEQSSTTSSEKRGRKSAKS
jgi:hypothetical protein